MTLPHRTPQYPKRRFNWLLQHLQDAISTLGKLCRTPLSSLLTAMVIGIALALPGGFYLIVNPIQHHSQYWTDNASTISVYLAQHLSEPEINQVHDRIRQEPGVAETRLIDKTQAMAEFRSHSGFGAALDLLDHNPLPAVVLVQPTLSQQRIDQTERLAARLQAWPDVDTAQVDLQWLHRFAAITRIATRGVMLLAVLLGIAVLLIIGNTIRLHIHNQQDEIAIMQLVGGTRAFIRRPYLYEGVWYGLSGTLVAYGLLSGAITLIQGPLQQLGSLYQTHLALNLNDPALALVLGCGSPLLGLSGAWLSVQQHLNQHH
ncbi:MAG: permease-like cell division protein FtsX [Pseudomonadota bacterium]